MAGFLPNVGGKMISIRLLLNTIHHIGLNVSTAHVFSSFSRGHNEKFTQAADLLPTLYRRAGRSSNAGRYCSSH
jgi:hypothetical protein